MSENGSKNVRNFYCCKYTEMADQNSEFKILRNLKFSEFKILGILNSEKLVKIGMSTSLKKNFSDIFTHFKNLQIIFSDIFTRILNPFLPII